jgi:hypothetical protein
VNMSDHAGGSNLSPWEELTVVSLGATAVAALLTVATWHKLLAYLVAQQVLVPASQSPLVKLPAGNGVGLDAPRLAIAVAAAVFGVVLLVATARRHGEEEVSKR